MSKNKSSKGNSHAMLDNTSRKHYTNKSLTSSVKTPGNTTQNDIRKESTMNNATSTSNDRKKSELDTVINPKTNNMRFLSLAQKQEMLAKKKYDSTIFVMIQRISTDGKAYGVPLRENVSRKMLLALSGAAAADLQDPKTTTWRVKDVSSKAVNQLISWMMLYCSTRAVPSIKVDGLSPGEWMDLWSAASRLNISLAVEQLTKQLHFDAGSCEMSFIVEAWSAATWLSLEIPSKHFKHLLHRFAWTEPLRPLDIKMLYTTAPDASFTEAAIDKTARGIFYDRNIEHETAVERLPEGIQKRFYTVFGNCQRQADEKHTNLKAKRAKEMEARHALGKSGEKFNTDFKSHAIPNRGGTEFRRGMHAQGSGFQGGIKNLHRKPQRYGPNRYGPQHAGHAASESQPGKSFTLKHSEFPTLAEAQLTRNKQRK